MIPQKMPKTMQTNPTLCVVVCSFLALAIKMHGLFLYMLKLRTMEISYFRILAISCGGVPCVCRHLLATVRRTQEDEKILLKSKKATDLENDSKSSRKKD